MSVVKGVGSLTNQDFLDFKVRVFGSARYSNKKCMRVFGMGEATFYVIKNSPDSKLQSWYAATLAAYQSMPVEQFMKTIKDLYDIDIRER